MHSLAFEKSGGGEGVSANVTNGSFKPFSQCQNGELGGVCENSSAFGNGKILRNSVATIIFCAVNTSQYMAIVCKHYMEW